MPQGPSAGRIESLQGLLARSKPLRLVPPERYGPRIAELLFPAYRDEKQLRVVPHAFGTERRFRLERLRRLRHPKAALALLSRRKHRAIRIAQVRGSSQAARASVSEVDRSDDRVPEGNRAGRERQETSDRSLWREACQDGTLFGIKSRPATTTTTVSQRCAQLSHTEAGRDALSSRSSSDAQHRPHFSQGTRTQRNLGRFHATAGGK